MPCRPGDNSINVPTSPPAALPGFGVPTSPLSFTTPGFDLPTDIIEDILELTQQLGALFPSGLFKPNPDGNMKDVLDFISNLFNQLAPFLSFYNFIMSALNLIVCIIEVLCAIPDPLAVASKLKKLFAECLPPFLNMFPWMALVTMILSLLLLILALIEYIIRTIISIIEELLENLIALQRAQALLDAEAALAITTKIASLLCIIENIFAILIAVAAIMSIIEALAKFAGIGICDDNDDEGCCPPEICPPFLKENKQIKVTDGTLIYYSKIGPDLSSLSLPAFLTSSLGASIELRKERWQLYNNESAEYPISDIITPTQSELYGSRIFYPEAEFNAETLPNSAPYTVDITLTLDPSVFHPSDTGGTRTFEIKDCIVVRKPYLGVIPYDNSSSQGTVPVPDTSISSSGTFNLEGGLVFESDGSPYELNGEQATLNTFIEQDNKILSSFPVIDDGYVIDGVEFIWKPNHPVLSSYDLITVGCMPEVGLEKAVQNAIITSEGIEPVLDRLDPAPDGILVPSTGSLPNVLGTQECVQNALNTLREDINTETVAEFQATVETCLGDLSNQVSSVYCDALLKGVSVFRSSFSIDPAIQFTTREITVTITLRDAGGTVIATNVPDSCLEQLLEKLSIEATLGKLGEFSYNSSTGEISAPLSSEKSGSGELQVSFDGEFFNDIIESLTFDTPSSIEESVISYEFVDATEDEAVDRDITDTSLSGS